MLKRLQNSGCKQVEEIWKRAGGSYLGLLTQIIKIIVYSAILGNHIYIYDKGYSYCFPNSVHTHTQTHTSIYMQN